MGPGRSTFWIPSPRLGACIVAWAVVLFLCIQGARPQVLSAESSREEDGSTERRKRRQEKRRQLIENILSGRWHGAALQEPVAVLLPREVGDELLPAVPIEAFLPQRMESIEFPLSSALLAEEARNWSRPSPVFESVFALPDQVMEVAARALQLLRPGNGGILDRLLDVGVENRSESLVPDLMGRLIEREQRYFAKFEETTAFDTLDVDDLVADQRKVIWEVLRRTYLSRYRVKADTLRDAAWDLQGWKGVDLLVVPPLMAGYALYHGVDRKFSIGETRGRLVIEPLSEWRGRDLPAGVGIEWAPWDWPVSFIVTAGLDDGRLRGDFVGIGTSIGMVRRLLTLEESEGALNRER